MRRGIFVLLSLVLAVSMAAIPADTISAKPSDLPQLSPASPAQQQEQEELIIEDILDELKYASSLTTDKDIRNHIKVIRDWVKKLQGFIRSGDTQAALDVKDAIAGRLEWLINQLPQQSPSTSTQMFTTAAPTTPSANPLYEELVAIRGKIEALIELEREVVGLVPLTPITPEIRRPPEMERLIVYSAKFLCGPAFGGEGVQPGSYSTAINVHNPYDQTVYLYKKAVVAEREDEPRGQISAFRKVVLRADEAIEIDCIDIGILLRPQPEPRKPTEEGRPSLTLKPGYDENMVGENHTITAIVAKNGNPVPGVEVQFELLEPDSVHSYKLGTLTKTTDASGQATGFTYSGDKEGKDIIVASATVDGYNLEAQATKVWTSKPTEEAQCPQGCECMTETQASVDNLALCQNQRIQCGSTVSTTTTATAATTVPMYCYEKPPQQVECPQGCFCADPGKADEEGLEWCLRNGDEIPCGEVRYCFRQPTGQPTSECPAGCECLTEDALQQGYTWCEGVRRQCGYDSAGNQMFCFEKGTAQSGPVRIVKAMPEETGLTVPSEQSGTVSRAPTVTPVRSLVRFVKGFVVIYATAPLDVVAVYTASTPVGFSLDVEYLQPSTRGVRPIPIPDEPEEPPPTEAECPYPCRCLTKDEAIEYGLTALCQRTEIPCAWDRYQNPTKFCFQEPEEPPPTEACPDACECVTQQEAEVLFQQGWNWCYGKQGWVCAYDQSGEEMYCLGPPEEEPTPTETQCPSECYCWTVNEGQGRGYDWCQGRQIECAWDQNQRPTKYCFQEPAKPTPTITECPEGCFCMDPKRALGADYEWCLRNGDEIPCGNGQYCFREPTTLRLLK